jgi:hypothetical protein
MPVSFSDLQLAFEFVSCGGMGENEAYLDRQSGKIYWRQLREIKALSCALIEFDAAGRLCHGNSIEHILRANARYVSCRCDGILPLCSSFGPEDPQCGSGDEVALEVEGVVNRTVHAEEALGRSS